MFLSVERLLHLNVVDDDFLLFIKTSWFLKDWEKTKDIILLFCWQFPRELCAQEIAKS